MCAKALLRLRLGVRPAAEDATRVAQEREEHARARAREMQAVRDWLQGQQQVVRRTVTASATATTTRPAMLFGKPAPEVAQTDLCLQALRSISRAATTKEIRDRIAREGHELDTDKVRNALRYLSTKKPPLVTTKSGSGMWRLVNPAPTVLVDPANISALNGEGVMR